MRKVCEVYLGSSSTSDDERGVELTFPVSQYEMMDAFEQIYTKAPGDVYWQVDEFYCFYYLAPHLDESMSIFEFNSLTEQLSKLDERQETAMQGLLQMQVNKHMQENSGPVTVQEMLKTAFGMIWMPCRTACMIFSTMQKSESRCARAKPACSRRTATLSERRNCSHCRTMSRNGKFPI